jgi:hypothetical protein
VPAERELGAAEVHAALNAGIRAAASRPRPCSPTAPTSPHPDTGKRQGGTRTRQWPRREALRLKTAHLLDGDR